MIVSIFQNSGYQVKMVGQEQVSMGSLGYMHQVAMGPVVVWAAPSVGCLSGQLTWSNTTLRSWSTWPNSQLLYLSTNNIRG